MAATAAGSYSAAMAGHYLVEQANGPAWHDTRAWREQAGSDQHATFMDALAAEGFIFLGGPIGEGDGDNALLISTRMTRRQSAPGWLPTRGPASC